MRMSSIQNSKTQTHSGDTSLFKTGKSQKIYICLSHAIELENTANQKARNPLHILRYATISYPESSGFLAAGQRREDSGDIEFYYRRISAVKQWKPLRNSQSKN